MARTAACWSGRRVEGASRYCPRPGTSVLFPLARLLLHMAEHSFNKLLSICPCPTLACSNSRKKVRFISGSEGRAALLQVRSCGPTLPAARAAACGPGLLAAACWAVPACSHSVLCCAVSALWRTMRSRASAA